LENPFDSKPIGNGGFKNKDSGKKCGKEKKTVIK